MKKQSAPVFQVALSKRRGAPARPNSTALKAAFLRAWALTPPTRYPEAFEHTRLSVNVLLVTDAEIAELNAQHMQHEGPTDVLSFPMGAFDFERNAFHIGDIVSSFQTARREADARGLSIEEELTRYCVHGLLHCLGYDDVTPAKRKAMFAVQEHAVNATGPAKKF